MELESELVPKSADFERILVPFLQRYWDRILVPFLEEELGTDFSSIFLGTVTTLLNIHESRHSQTRYKPFFFFDFELGSPF